MRARLRVAAGTLLALLVLGTSVRLGFAAGPTGMDGRVLVAPLLGVAGLCVLGLSARRSLSIAWLACVFVALMAAATVEPVWAEVREGRVLGGPVAGSGGGSPASEPIALAVAALVRAAVLAPAVVAAMYATDRPCMAARWVPPVAWGLVTLLALVVSIGFAQFATGSEPEAVTGIPAFAWLGAILGVVLLGAWGDIAPAAVRVQTRVGRDPALRGPVVRLRLLAEELLPGREAARAEAAETERGRLASDLHAEILPGLRAALVAAESGGSAERLSAQLRGAVADVEGLLAARRSIVLEELGLIAGLEWLAERVEERSAVRVELRVEGADASPGRPPRTVERAAFRIAQLALDNVARHAPEASVAVSVVASPARVALSVRDDGPGLEGGQEVPGRRVVPGGQGLADMRAEAASCGGGLAIDAGHGGRGVDIVFRWPAPLREGT